MAVFEYKAVHRKRTIQDSLTAANLEDAKTVLKSKGYKIVWLKEKSGVAKGKGGKKVPVLEKANFCRYLSTMIESGLPLTEAVDVYAQDTSNKAFKSILDDVLAGLEKGQALSTGFSRHPRVFDSLFIALIRAGEASGTLAKSFEYLSKQLFADYDLRRKVKGAMMYPAVVITVMAFILMLLIFFVLPKIAPIFLQMGLELPLVTKVILKVGIWMSGHTLLAIIGGISFMVGLFIALRWDKSRVALLKLVTLVPQIRRLVDQLDMARFSRIFSTLMASGVAVNEIVSLVFSSLSQDKYRRLSGVFEEEVKKGSQISAILRREKVFPRIVVRMVATGEKAGTMDKMLLYLADFYEGEVENQLHDLTNLLEPVLMLVVGVGVGILVLSVIAPIYSLVGSLSM
jgi:type IV pilus assembly protein PilC